MTYCTDELIFLKTDAKAATAVTMLGRVITPMTDAIIAFVRAIILDKHAATVSKTNVKSPHHHCLCTSGHFGHTCGYSK